MNIALWYDCRTLGSFETALMDLIDKADRENKAKIAICFPEYVEAYNLWFNGSYKEAKGDNDN
jgi:hypothetical protein